MEWGFIPCISIVDVLTTVWIIYAMQVTVACRCSVFFSLENNAPDTYRNDINEILLSDGKYH